jgi:hypothetical protein
MTMSAPNATKADVVNTPRPYDLDWQEVPALGRSWSAGAEYAERPDGHRFVRTMDRPEVIVNFSPAQWTAFIRFLSNLGTSR